MPLEPEPPSSPDPPSSPSSPDRPPLEPDPEPEPELPPETGSGACAAVGRRRSSPSCVPPIPWRRGPRRPGRPLVVAAVVRVELGGRRPPRHPSVAGSSSPTSGSSWPRRRRPAGAAHGGRRPTSPGRRQGGRRLVQLGRRGWTARGSPSAIAIPRADHGRARSLGDDHGVDRQAEGVGGRAHQAGQRAGCQGHGGRRRSTAVPTRTDEGRLTAASGPARTGRRTGSPALAAARLCRPAAVGEPAGRQLLGGRDRAEDASRAGRRRASRAAPPRRWTRSFSRRRAALSHRRTAPGFLPGPQRRPSLLRPATTSQLQRARGSACELKLESENRGADGGGLPRRRSETICRARDDRSWARPTQPCGARRPGGRCWSATTAAADPERPALGRAREDSKRSRWP